MSESHPKVSHQLQYPNYLPPHEQDAAYEQHPDWVGLTAEQIDGFRRTLHDDAQQSQSRALVRSASRFDYFLGHHVDYLFRTPYYELKVGDRDLLALRALLDALAEYPFLDRDTIDILAEAHVRSPSALRSKTAPSFISFLQEELGAESPQFINDVVKLLHKEFPSQLIPSLRWLKASQSALEIIRSEDSEQVLIERLTELIHEKNAGREITNSLIRTKKYLLTEFLKSKTIVWPEGSSKVATKFLAFIGSLPKRDSTAIFKACRKHNNFVALEAPFQSFREFLEAGYQVGDLDAALDRFGRGAELLQEPSPVELRALNKLCCDGLGDLFRHQLGVLNFEREIKMAFMLMGKLSLPVLLACINGRYGYRLNRNIRRAGAIYDVASRDYFMTIFSCLAIPYKLLLEGRISESTFRRLGSVLMLGHAGANQCFYSAITGMTFVTEQQLSTAASLIERDTRDGWLFRTLMVHSTVLDQDLALMDQALSNYDNTPVLQVISPSHFPLGLQMAVYAHLLAEDKRDDDNGLKFQMFRYFLLLELMQLAHQGEEIPLQRLVKPLADFWQSTKKGSVRQCLSLVLSRHDGDATLFPAELLVLVHDHILLANDLVLAAFMANIETAQSADTIKVAVELLQKNLDLVGQDFSDYQNFPDRQSLIQDIEGRVQELVHGREPFDDDKWLRFQMFRYFLLLELMKSAHQGGKIPLQRLVRSLVDCWRLSKTGLGRQFLGLVLSRYDGDAEIFPAELLVLVHAHIFLVDDSVLTAFMFNISTAQSADTIKAAVELLQRNLDFKGQDFSDYQNYPDRQSLIQDIEGRVQELVHGREPVAEPDLKELLAIEQVLVSSNLSRKSIASILSLSELVPQDTRIGTHKARTFEITLEESLYARVHRGLVADYVAPLQQIADLPRLALWLGQLIKNYRAEGLKLVREDILKFFGWDGQTAVDLSQEAEKVSPDNALPLLDALMLALGRHRQSAKGMKSIIPLLIARTWHRSAVGHLHPAITTFKPKATVEVLIDAIGALHEFYVNHLHDTVSDVLGNDKNMAGFLTRAGQRLSKQLEQVQTKALGKVEMALVPSRNKLDAFFGYMAQDCLASDAYAVTALSDSCFIPYRIIVENRWMGVVFTLTVWEGKQKLLLVPGIEPRTELNMNVDEFLDGVEEALRQNALEHDYALVLIPARGDAQSSRTATVQPKIRARYTKNYSTKTAHGFPLNSEGDYYAKHQNFKIIHDLRGVKRISGGIGDPLSDKNIGQTDAERIELALTVLNAGVDREDVSLARAREFLMTAQAEGRLSSDQIAQSKPVWISDKPEEIFSNMMPLLSPSPAIMAAMAESRRHLTPAFRQELDRAYRTAGLANPHQWPQWMDAANQDLLEPVAEAGALARRDSLIPQGALVLYHRSLEAILSNTNLVTTNTGGFLLSLQGKERVVADESMNHHLPVRGDEVSYQDLFDFYKSVFYQARDFGPYLILLKNRGADIEALAPLVDEMKEGLTNALRNILLKQGGAALADMKAVDLSVQEFQRLLRETARGVGVMIHPVTGMMYPAPQTRGAATARAQAQLPIVARPAHTIQSQVPRLEAGNKSLSANTLTETPKMAQWIERKVLPKAKLALAQRPITAKSWGLKNFRTLPSGRLRSSIWSHQARLR